MAEVPDVTIGFYAGDLGERRAHAVTGICRLAGADKSLIRTCTEEGQRPAEVAPKPLFTRQR